MTHLDSDTVVAYLRGNAGVAARLHQTAPLVAISSVVLGELLFGAKLSARPAGNLADVSRLLALAPLVVFDQACADAYADAKLALRRIGRPTGEVDLLIAATAIAHNATLVTHNTAHFRDIPGLNLEDWIE